MKRWLALGLFALSGVVFGQNELKYQQLQINSAGSGYNAYHVAAPGSGSCFWTLNADAGNPTCTDAAGLAQQPSDWLAASGPARILNKPTLFSGSYLDLTNKPTIPAAGPTIQRVRLQTDTSGALTWTFPSAFGAAPIVTADVETGDADTWSLKITAVSASQVSIQLTRTAVVSVLGINVLGVSSSTPQAYVHLTAIQP